MFVVQVPDFLIRLSQEFCANQKLGKRNDGSDGRPDHQLRGVICQNAILFGLGLPLMESSTDHDGGVDLILDGVKIDIKSTRILGPIKRHHLHQVPEAQLKFDVDVYIFCALDDEQMKLSITGWLTKKQFLHKAIVNKAGDAIMFSGKSYVNRMSTRYVYAWMVNSEAHNFEELRDHITQ